MSTNAWKAYAVRYARQLERRPAHLTYIDGRPDETASGLDYYFWVLAREGRAIVVDTGMSEEACRKMGREWLGRPADILDRLGFPASSISDVIVTHCHMDHVGNLGQFPNASFWLQGEEMRAITGEEMTYPVFSHAYDRDHTIELVNLLYDGRLRLLNGDGEFAPGIDLFLVGGHSRGQMVVRVRTERGDVLLASDAIHLYDEWEQERPFFVFDDLKTMLRGYRTCTRLSGGIEALIPGHDPAVATLYPPVPGLDGLVFDLTTQPTTSGAK